jgi:hypothetical protein
LLQIYRNRKSKNHLNESIGQELLMRLGGLVKLMWRLGRRLSRGEPGSRQAIQAKRSEHLQKVVAGAFKMPRRRVRIENEKLFRNHHGWSTMISYRSSLYSIRDDF